MTGKAMLLLAIVQPQSAQPPDTAGFQTILGWVLWAVTASCLAGVLVTCTQMALAHRSGGGHNEHASRLGWVLAAAILSGAAAALINGVS